MAMDLIQLDDDMSYGFVIDKLVVNPIPLLFQESLSIKDLTNFYSYFKKYKCQKGENGILNTFQNNNINYLET